MCYVGAVLCVQMKFCARRRGRFASEALVIAVLIRPLANGSKMGP